MTTACARLLQGETTIRVSTPQFIIGSILTVATAALALYGALYAIHYYAPNWSSYINAIMPATVPLATGVMGANFIAWCVFGVYSLCGKKYNFEKTETTNVFTN